MYVVIPLLIVSYKSLMSPSFKSASSSNSEVCSESSVITSDILDISSAHEETSV